MRCLEYLLILLIIKVSASSYFEKSNFKRYWEQTHEIEEGEIIEDSQANKISKISGSGANFETKGPELPNRNEIFSYFAKCKISKIEEILFSDYDIISNGIWNDLIELRNYKAIKYMLINHFTADSFHINTFELAIVNGSTSLAEFLMKNSVNVLRLRESELIALACSFNRYKILDIMRIAGFRVNLSEYDPLRKSLLHLVVEQDNVRLLKTLIKFHDIEINKYDSNQSTPLHFVKSIEMAELLIKYGAVPLIYNADRMTAVDMAAARSNDSKLAKALESDLNTRLRLFINVNKLAESYQTVFTFIINRQRVLEDSFNFASKNNSWYRSDSEFNFKAAFKGEPGFDQGGLTREWISLLIDRFFVARMPPENVNLVLNSDLAIEESDVLAGSVFTDDSFSTYFTLTNRVPLPFDSTSNFDFYYSPFECIDFENKLYTISPKFTGSPKVYKFIGSIIAKSILYKIPLKVKLAPSLIKLIFGQSLKFEDLEFEDYVIYRSMLYCLDSSFDFEAAQYVLPSDESVKITLENVHEFLNETAINCMYYRYRKQIDQLILGFRSIIKYEQLKSYFDNEEVLKILLGQEKIDKGDLKNDIVILSPYWNMHRDEFLGAIDILEPSELIQLIHFITGINGLPYGGFKSLGKAIKVYDDTLEIPLPRSSTCNFHLIIPSSYLTKEELVEGLRISLSSTPEFNDQWC